MKRLFIAIKILPDEHFLRLFYALQKDLKKDNIKWVNPENLHLTLKFLGETDDDKIEIIKSVLEKISGDKEPFWVTFSKTGIFGSSYKPKVIWFGMNDQNQINELGNKVRLGLDEAGFPIDRQNFVPHLTVGRIRNISYKKSFQETIDKYKDAPLQKIFVKEFYLFESVLMPKGAKYIILKTFTLKSNT